MPYDLPPPRDWQVFEDLCCELWRCLWRDPNAQKHGRSGQKQHGVDVFGQPDGGPDWEGVQCKRYEQPLSGEQIQMEVDAARDFWRGRLRRLIVATTAKRDTGSQGAAAAISNSQVADGSFPVSLWSWDDVTDEIAKHADLMRQFYPWISETVRHLPYPSLGSLFQGRDALLEALAGGSETTAFVQPETIHGLGGVGKSRLAVEYAWRYGDRHPGGAFFVSAESPEGLRSELAGLARVLDLPEKEADEATALAAVLAWLRSRGEWLLILDNADTAEAAAAVDALLPDLAGGRVLITSRWTSWPREVREQPVDVLELEAARRYLLDATVRRMLTPDDESEAERLAELLGYLPLALEQAAAYVERHRLRLADYQREWQGERERVLAWHDPTRTHYPVAVAVTWQRTFEVLSPGTQTVLRLASLLAPGPIPEAIFGPGVAAVKAAQAALCAELGREAGPWEARDALAELADYSLAARGGGAMVVHRLVQEVVQSRIPEDERRAWVEWALGMVNTATPTQPDDVRTWPVLDPLRPHIARIAKAADEAGIAVPTSRLMNDLGLMLKTKGLYDLAEPLMHRTLEIDEASLGPDHPDIARDLNNLAQLLLATNRPEEAEPLMRRALKILEDSLGAEHTRVATALTNLAWLLHDTNRLEEAEPFHRRALEIDEASFGQDHPHVARDLNNLVSLLQATNRLKEAEPLMQRALAICLASLGDEHHTTVTVHKNYSTLLRRMGRVGDAEAVEA